MTRGMPRSIMYIKYGIRKAPVQTEETNCVKLFKSITVRSSTTIGVGGLVHPPTFSHFRVFTVLTPLPPPTSNALTPHLQIRGASLGCGCYNIY